MVHTPRDAILTAQAHIQGLAVCSGHLHGADSVLLPGLPVTTTVSAAEVGESFPTSSLQTSGHCPHYLLITIPFLLSPCLFCSTLLKQHGRDFSLLGKEREKRPSLGCACRLLPHTQGLWELAACTSSLFESQWPEASLQPPGAIFQTAQPLRNRAVKEV